MRSFGSWPERGALALASSLAACASPVPLEASGHVLHEGDHDAVEVVARTAPGAEVTVTGPEGPSDPVRADANGRAVVRVRDGVEHHQRQYTVFAGIEGRGPTIEIDVPDSMRLMRPHRTSSAECHGSSNANERCRISVYSDGIAHVSEAEPGATAESGAGHAVVGADHTASVPLDLQAYLSALDVGAIFGGSGDEPGLEVPMSVRFRGGNEASGEVFVPRIAVASALAHHFERATSGGVEPNVAPTGSALVSVGLENPPPAILLGEAAHPSDVRWVATVEHRRRSLRDCGVYRSLTGGSSDVVTRIAIDLVVRIVERQHGTIVSEHTFAGVEPGCGSIALRSERIGAARTAEAREWIQSEHSRLAAPR